ncbi:hypothetical protein TNCV_3516841 [Trichonephila clavipes]|nr:hypothetical protein TNCV_3516841 [Trichonephila clavipes]
MGGRPGVGANGTRFHGTIDSLKLWFPWKAVPLFNVRYDCCKRWGYVRDYYIRRRGNLAAVLQNSSKKRSELLSFLDSFAVSQRTTTTNVGLSDVTQFSSTEPDFDSGPEILDPDSNDYFEKMEEENFKEPTSTAVNLQSASTTANITIEW